MTAGPVDLPRAPRASDALALTIVGVLSTAVLVALPVLAAAMSRQVGGDAAALGYLASADMLGSAIAATVIATLFDRVDWRMPVAVALAFSVAGNLASAVATDVVQLFAIRTFVGLCNGVVLCVCFVGLCRSASPDRAFGIYVLLQLLLQATLLPGLAQAAEMGGAARLYEVLAMLSVPAFLLLVLFPNALDVNRWLRVDTRGARTFWALTTVVAVGIYFVAPAMVWGFFEPIGRQFGLSTTAVATALGLSAFAGIAGAVAVLATGDRLRRSVSIALGVGLSILSLIPAFGGSGYEAFLIVTCVFNFAWNFTFPFLMGVVALHDRAGETAIQSLAAQLFGLAAGPFVGAMLIEAGVDQHGVIMAALAIFALSFLIFLQAERAALARPATEDAAR